MRILITTIILLIMISFGNIFGQKAAPLAEKSIYDFVMETIDGEQLAFESLKGKKFMIVNVASKCGLTPQYKKLQELFESFKESGFEIIGFPANNFMSQEPGSNEEIASFCQKNYGVDFQMMAKIDVKGKNRHPLYTFLTQKKYNGLKDNTVKWNFQKYLIDENGQLAKVIGPRTSPMDDEVKDWLATRE